ncbi:hypothetical protein [Bacillus altitudinis]|nr:hypothetical protein [Bacillus altitudinis]
MVEKVKSVCNGRELKIGGEKMEFEEKGGLSGEMRAGGVKDVGMG